jgi:hypothetical protein
LPKKPAAPGSLRVREPEYALVSELLNHPRNYREHPPEQVAHLVESMREHGVYRNVVVARDGRTILAGHGVVKAAREGGLERILVVKLDLDPTEPRALKVVAADNEIGNLAEVDDRILTDLLRDVKEFDPDGLLGTGVDEEKLANMIFVTRPRSEIKDFDAAAEWVGMPEFVPEPAPLKITVQFKTAEDRSRFLKLIGVEEVSELRPSMWWPKRKHDDLASVKFEG